MFRQQFINSIHNFSFTASSFSSSSSSSTIISSELDWCGQWSTLLQNIRYIWRHACQGDEVLEQV
jgi:hypothetical protein